MLSKEDLIDVLETHIGDTANILLWQFAAIAIYIN
jgi:hypothetical protein